MKIDFAFRANVETMEGNISVVADFLVVAEGKRSLLGRSTASDLKLLFVGSINNSEEVHTPIFLKRFQHKKNQQNKLLNFRKIFAEFQHNVADQLSKLLDGSESLKIIADIQ